MLYGAELFGGMSLLLFFLQVPRLCLLMMLVKSVTSRWTKPWATSSDRIRRHRHLLVMSRVLTARLMTALLPIDYGGRLMSPCRLR